MKDKIYKDLVSYYKLNEHSVEFQRGFKEGMRPNRTSFLERIGYVAALEENPNDVEEKAYCVAGLLRLGCK